MIYHLPHLWTSALNPADDAIVMPSGDEYIVDSANASWSLSASDDSLLRFELRHGDFWPADTQPASPALGIARDELGGVAFYAYGSPVEVGYNFTLLAGSIRSASWCVVGQLHQDDYSGEVSTSPPFAMEIGYRLDSNGATPPVYNVPNNYFKCNIGYTLTIGGVDIQKHLDVWQSQTPINRASDFSASVDIKACFVPTPTGTAVGTVGQLLLTVGGYTAAKYTGPLGTAESHTKVFWKEGIYSEDNAATIAAEFGALTIGTTGTILTTGSTPAVPSGCISVLDTYGFDSAGANAVTTHRETKSDQSFTVWNYCMTSGNHFAASIYKYGASSTAADGPLLEYTTYSTASGHNRLFDEVYNSDGSTDSTYYDASGSGVVTRTAHVYATGTVSSVYYTSGVISSKFIQFSLTDPGAAGRASQEDDYGLGDGTTVTKEIIINTDGSKSSELFHLTGSYDEQKTFYNTDGTTINRITRKSGSVMVYQALYASDPTSDITTYDPTSGHATNEIVTSAAGVVTTNNYASDGTTLVNKNVHNADGSTVYTVYTAGVPTTETDTNSSLTTVKHFASDGVTINYEVFTLTAGGQTVASVGSGDSFTNYSGGGNKFQFPASGFGAVIINAFHVANDKLRLPSASWPGGASVALAAMANVGGTNATLTVGSEYIKLSGVDKATMTTSNIELY